MAVVTVVATGIGFWLSYAGLHSFAVRAGVTGAEAWAWPSSVDLFILAGELGITISTLRDGRYDWRAWVYFGAGCGPSVTFNILHASAQLPEWTRYAVGATPPVAAVLALAALMTQVMSLPKALEHMRQGWAQPEAPVSAPDPVTLRASLNGHAGKAERLYRDDITAGMVPGIRRIMRDMHVGDDRARLVQQHLKNVAGSVADA